MTERRLIVMRHAKSSWGDSTLDDHQRPLNKRGRNDTPRIAERLVELGWAPESVWSSDSERTQETWTRMVEPFDDAGITVHFRRELYLAGVQAIRGLALEWDPAHRTILTLGHNPGWEEAVSTLCGEETHMTTANAALLVGEGETWSEALEGSWRLEELLRPKEL